MLERRLASERFADERLCSRRATILPSGNLLRRSDSSSSARTSWSDRILAREQRALLTRWSSVLHSKTSLVYLGHSHLRSNCPYAAWRLMDLSLICHRQIICQEQIRSCRNNYLREISFILASECKDPFGKRKRSQATV